MESNYIVVESFPCFSPVFELKWLSISSKLQNALCICRKLWICAICGLITNSTECFVFGQITSHVKIPSELINSESCNVNCGRHFFPYIQKIKSQKHTQSNLHTHTQTNEKWEREEIFFSSDGHFFFWDSKILERFSTFFIFFILAFQLNMTPHLANTHSAINSVCCINFSLIIWSFFSHVFSLFVPQ